MMYTTNPGQLAMFDVDDTLLAWEIPDNFSGPIVEVECRGNIVKKAVNIHNLKLLKSLAETGHEIVVWSASGVDWAKAAVIALEISDYVSVVMQKPAYYIDDKKDPTKWIGKNIFIDIDGNIKES